MIPLPQLLSIRFEIRRVRACCCSARTKRPSSWCTTWAFYAACVSRMTLPRTYMPLICFEQSTLDAIETINPAPSVHTSPVCQQTRHTCGKRACELCAGWASSIQRSVLIQTADTQSGIKGKRVDGTKLTVSTCMFATCQRSAARAAAPSDPRTSSPRRCAMLNETHHVVGALLAGPTFKQGLEDPFCTCTPGR